MKFTTRIRRIRFAQARQAILACIAYSGISSAGAEESGTRLFPALDLFYAQATAVGQRLFPFKSPYSGDNSLPDTGQHKLSHSYVLAIGKRLSPSVDAYTDVRVLRGQGIGNENGLAGYANGDFSAAAGASPLYINRAYLRFTHPLGARMHAQEAGLNQIPGDEPLERIEIKLGRILPSDDFDENRYATSAVTQFLSLGLVNSPAWDNEWIDACRVGVWTGRRRCCQSRSFATAIGARRSSAPSTSRSPRSGSSGASARAYPACCSRRGSSRAPNSSRRCRGSSPIDARRASICKFSRRRCRLPVSTFK